MKKLFLIILIAAFSLIALAKVFAAAGIPKILNFQGRLLDASGILLGESGTEFCFKFSFYDDAAVGAPDNKLWPAGSPSTMTVLVKNGVFDVGIGNILIGGDVLDFDFQSQDEIYVNTEVAQKVGVTCAPGDGAEVFENLSPRQRVVSSGYSINSDTLDGFHAAPSASGNQIPVLTGGNLFLGSLAPQINATSSNSLTIQGNALSGNLLLNPLSGFVGIGTTSPGQLLSVQGNAFFSGNLSNVANIKATGTLDVFGLSTLAGGYISQASSTVTGNLVVIGGLNASSTLTVAGNSVFYSNVGIGTTSPWGFLSVDAKGISGPAFVVGSSTSVLFSITQGTSGLLDFSRVTVGGLAKEDQLYVHGRINSSWRVYQKELMATCAPLSNILVDAADICGLVFDEDVDGGVLARVANSSAIRIRANAFGIGFGSANDGVILGSGGPLAMTRNNNPVMEARVMPITLTNHRLEVGFTNRLFNGDITTDPADGVYFRVTPASLNWIAVNRADGVETGSTVDTGIAVSTTNFQELRIEINGSVNTRFFIDGELVAAITADIPTGNLGFSVGNAIAATADEPKDFDIESIKVWIDDPPAGISGEMATTSVPELTNSEIQTAEAADSGLGDMISRILALLGLLIENGIAKFQELIAEKAVIKDAEVENLSISGKMQMRDQATDEIYCVWFENGEWKKLLRSCENILINSATTTDSVINQDATSTQNSN